MPLALRTLEFDRIVDVVSGLAITPLGAEALDAERQATGVGLARRLIWAAA